ncbi:sigma-70 family RNA polymerase sigma factor [Lentilactobacillus sp. Marseille-Q4993]|uniref:sigma-70 family RNA polymerase sigma factor n=1 Tax=Lentilactobacillus sp. Marseille-Q4993 TaxID=3039492 RepID=UPI0024BC2B25|nr:sigma-70 family RNA polymerase sigma factor [Lentilactobacillus sp. Marseille-Q4993]
MFDKDELDLIEKVTQKDDEAFAQLFKQYYPVVNKLRTEYYVNGMDNDDWDQEARIIMYRAARKFDPNYRSNFGSFYSRLLKHRIFDLIRRHNAQKRLPAEPLVSIDSDESYYEATVEDPRVNCPEGTTVMKDTLANVLDQCTPLERDALLEIISRPSEAFDENAHRVFLNAFDRVKRKYLKERN